MLADLGDDLVQHFCAPGLGFRVLHAAFQFGQHLRGKEGVDVWPDLDLQLRVAHVGDVEAVDVRGLDLAEQEFGGLAGVGGVFAGVEAGADAQERLQGDRGVADVGGIGHVVTFDATALAIG